DRHAVVDVIEHSRLNEITAGFLQDAFAAEYKLRAFALAHFDIAKNPFEMLFLDQRTHAGVLGKGVSDLPRLEVLDNRLKKTILQAGVHQQARAGAAVFAL